MKSIEMQALGVDDVAFLTPHYVNGNVEIKLAEKTPYADAVYANDQPNKEHL